MVLADTPIWIWIGEQWRSVEGRRDDSAREQYTTNNERQSGAESNRGKKASTHLLGSSSLFVPPASKETLVPISPRFEAFSFLPPRRVPTLTLMAVEMAAPSRTKSPSSEILLIDNELPDLSVSEFLATTELAVAMLPSATAAVADRGATRQPAARAKPPQKATRGAHM